MTPMKQGRISSILPCCQLPTALSVGEIAHADKPQGVEEFKMYHSILGRYPMKNLAVQVRLSGSRF